MSMSTTPASSPALSGHHATAVLRRVRGVANAMDAAVPIPGTKFHVGLDALIGLIPGIGDLAGAAISTYIILEAQRLGLPRSALARMAANVAVDAAIGSIPLLGDLFDAGWKANLRNVAILERHLEARGH